MDPQLEQIVQRMIDAGEGEEAIASVIREYPAVASQVAPQSPEGTLMGFLRGAGSRVAELPGMLKSLVTTNPLTTAKGILYDAPKAQFEQAGRDFGEGRISEGIGRSVAGAVPFLGPIAGEIGGKIGSGEPRQSGSAAIDAAMLALGSPTARSGVATAARGVGNVAKGPVGQAALGAGVGYATGGLPGAAAGAAGGGVMGRVIAALERMAPKAVEGESGVTWPSPTARGSSRWNPTATAAEEPMTASGSIRRTPTATADIESPPTASLRIGSDPTRDAMAAFNRQTPELLESGAVMPGEVAPTVSAPGFSLGEVVEAPTAARLRTTPSPAAAAEAMQALQRGERGGGIDWRTTDAVPVDALSRAKTILEPGESQIGLGERLATALKSNDPAALVEAAQLAKAIRQRMHIGESGR